MVAHGKKSASAPSPATPVNAAATLQLLADPTRAEIVRSVWHGERSAGDIARGLPVTFGCVSQHLSKLSDAGVLQRRVEGKRRLYAVNRPALGALATALQAMWFDKLTTLKSLAEAAERSPLFVGAPSTGPSPRTRSKAVRRQAPSVRSNRKGSS